MFVQAIEKAAAFTRPIHTITRNYGSQSVSPASASLFFVNPDGWALTCKHVTDLIVQTDQVNRRYRQFRIEAAKMMTRKNWKSALKDLEKTYGYTERITVEIKNMFINCVEGKLNIRIIPHPNLDVALIKFSSGRVLCDRFPVFPSDSSSLRPGLTLCRLGYPFPDFTNFHYDEGKDEIEWTQEGRLNTPLFPIDGMLTRMILQGGNRQQTVSGFELSTPGLRGQSGGPVFDQDGKVWGIQSATCHLYLGFDIHQEVFKLGRMTTVSDNAFLHVGRCVHVDRIKEFLKQNDVGFQEG